MTNRFVLLPLEYKGADFDPSAQARTRLSLGGSARNFLLKMHGNTLFFKELGRAPVYAVFGEFDPSLARDASSLIKVWKREVERDNFGAFTCRRDYFSGLNVRGHFLFLVQSQGRIWIKEHFDARWFELPPHDKPFGVFDPKGVEHVVAALLKPAQTLLSDRVLDPSIRSL